jgi:hypothetical protein
MCSGAHPRDISNHHAGEEGRLGGVVRWDCGRWSTELSRTGSSSGNWCCCLRALLRRAVASALLSYGRGSMEATKGPAFDGEKTMTAATRSRSPRRGPTMRGRNRGGARARAATATPPSSELPLRVRKILATRDRPHSQSRPKHDDTEEASRYWSRWQPRLVASTSWPRVPPSNAVEAATGKPRGPLSGAPKSRRRRLHARQHQGWVVRRGGWQKHEFVWLIWRIVFGW